VPATGDGLPRKLERRLALSAEYGVKAVYATLIGIGTKSAYDSDDLTRYVVVAGWTDSLRRERGLSGVHPVTTLDRGYTVLAVPRYTPYRDALLALAARRDRVRVAEIGGNPIVTLTGTAPAGWRAPPRTEVVVAYDAPDGSRTRRVLLRTSARDLLDVLALSGESGGIRIDHIYDY
jgi:hypothetical protein